MKKKYQIESYSTFIYHFVHKEGNIGYWQTAMNIDAIVIVNYFGTVLDRRYEHYPQ